MRTVLIAALERLLGLFVILALIGVGVLAWFALVSGQPQAPLKAVMVLVSGVVAIILGFGTVYVSLGIYANTRRTADAVEALLRAGEGRRAGAVAGPSADGPARRSGPPSVQAPVRPDTPRR